MNHRTTLTAMSACLLAAGLAGPIGNAAAQSAKDLVGTYAIVSARSTDAAGKEVDGWGANPRGQIIFTSDGRYSITLLRAGLPKFASNNRSKGTAAENQAVVAGFIAHYGRYTVDETDKTLTFQLEASSYPNWDGITQKRAFTLSGGEFKYTVVAGSSGGGAVLTWKRI